jgi:hypothetical protein
MSCQCFVSDAPEPFLPVKRYSKPTNNKFYFHFNGQSNIINHKNLDGNAQKVTDNFFSVIFLREKNRKHKKKDER